MSNYESHPNGLARMLPKSWKLIETMQIGTNASQLAHVELIGLASSTHWRSTRQLYSHAISEAQLTHAGIQPEVPLPYWMQMNNIAPNNLKFVAICALGLRFCNLVPPPTSDIQLHQADSLNMFEELGRLNQNPGAFPTAEALNNQSYFWNEVRSNTTKPPELLYPFCSPKDSVSFITTAQIQIGYLRAIHRIPRIECKNKELDEMLVKLTTKPGIFQN